MSLRRCGPWFTERTQRVALVMALQCTVDAIFPGEKVPSGENDFIDITKFVFADITA
jgi:hypothetical protein